MNSLVIPPSPNWFQPDILACAPDNTIIYGSRNNIIVIKPTPPDQADDVRIITRAHSVKIRSISVNKNWGTPHKYAVTLSKNNIVKLWDIERLERKLAHNKHVLDDATEVIGASFAGDDRVISASESGTIVIWNLIQNETTVLKTLFKGNKDKLTTFSVCPHAAWLTAFGMKSGLITVTDLRKTGNVLYTLRGHSKPVVSLCWCPAPVNIFPMKPHNKVVEKKSESVEDVKAETSVVASDIPDVDGNRRKQKNPRKLSMTEGYYRNKTEDRVPPADTEVLSMKDSEAVQVEVAKTSGETLSAQSAQNVEAATEAASKEDKSVSRADRQTVQPKVAETSAETLSAQSKPIAEAASKESKILSMEDPQTLQENVAETNVEILSAQSEPIAEAASRESKVLLMEHPQTVQEKVAETSTEILSAQSEPIAEAAIKESKVLSNEDSQTVQAKVAESSVETLSAQSEPIAEAASKESKVSMEDPQTVQTEVAEISTETLSAQPELIVEDASKESKALSMESQTVQAELPKTSTEVLSAQSGPIAEAAHNESGNLSSTTCAENGAESSNRRVENGDQADVENWRVAEPVCVEEEPRKEFLLASSAREPKIYIWRAGTDGRLETFLTVPTVKQRNKKSWSPNSDAIWITLCWAAPNVLLSSNKEAELLHWTLPKPLVQSTFPRKIHSDHWSVLFSIKAPIIYSNEYNFLQKREICAWTTGKERMLISTNIRSMTNLACYPTLGGSINCLAGSPLDPNRLAIGTGEGTVHLWDLGQAHKKSIMFLTFYQKILSGVTALAWHPAIENSLAWGTTEGRIGLIDISGKGKNPKILPQFCTSQIFKLEWGPPHEETDRRHLFAVSGSNVAIFDPKSNETDPKVLEVPSDMPVYTIAWKPSYSKLLVVTKSGTLITYSRDLEVLTVTYISRKFESIVWHPDAASDDVAVSKYSETFVSIAKFTEVTVFDLSVKSENLEDKIITRFQNRDVHINNIAWSPHSGNHLVLVDEEGIAQVYDIEAKSSISTYINPCLDPVLAVHWSPVDPDYVIVGTTGNKIVVWKISQNTALTDKEINKERNKLIKAQQKIVNDNMIKEPEQLSDKEAFAPKSKSQKKSLVVPLFYSASDNCKAQDLNKLLEWKLGNATIESNIGDSRHIDVLDVFGDDPTKTERIFEVNLLSFKEKGKHQAFNLLSLFQGDITTVVKDAIEQKRVDPWIISLCPMVSPKLWQTACRTYAEQLRHERKDPLEAVTYFLACHMVEEAVQFLCEEELFREALVLAKVRFGADNPMTFDVLDQWAKYCALQGNFELGACCYITMGKFGDAASLLFRRSSVEILKIAAELAKLSENSELHKAVVFRLNAFMLQDTNKESSGTLEEVIEENDESETRSAEETEVKEKAEYSSFDNKNNGDLASPVRISTDSSVMAVMETTDSSLLLDTRNEQEENGIEGKIIKGEDNDI